VRAHCRWSARTKLTTREDRSVDGQTMARTPKRRVDTTVWTEMIKLEDIDEWHECSRSGVDSCVVNSLTPLETALRLYRRTRFSNQPPETVCIGYVRVDARDLDADQAYEKKLPLLAFLTTDVIGQIRLTIKSDQLNVKGLAAYDVITEVCTQESLWLSLAVLTNVSSHPGDTFGRRQADLQSGRTRLGRGRCGCSMSDRAVKGSTRVSHLRPYRRGGSDP
jgi:hypothetical protein